MHAGSSEAHAACASGGRTHGAFRQGLRAFCCAFAAPCPDRERPRRPVPPASPRAMAGSRTRAPAASGCMPGPRDALRAPRPVCVAGDGPAVGGAGPPRPRPRPPLAHAMQSRHPDIARGSALRRRARRALSRATRGPTTSGWRLGRSSSVTRTRSVASLPMWLAPVLGCPWGTMSRRMG